MKKKYILMALTLMAGLVSCDKFLDVNPDNRAELDSDEKIIALLGSAYSFNTYITMTDMMSDNMDCYAPEFTNNRKMFFDQVWNWEDVTESDNESPERVWNSNYNAIASANHAIQAIEELGGPSVSMALSQAYGEALLCRAYGHFTLVNFFCLAYNSETSSTDLGIPYITEPENGLKPEYGRGTVAGVYAAIDKDIQEGLKYVGDSNYEVPKFHFNTQAALAFATQFYVFYEKWDEALKYADLCLGSKPESLLRDYVYLGTLPTNASVRTQQYVDSSNPCNFLLHTAYSVQGLWWGFYSSANMYSHGEALANAEDISARHPWGSGGWREGGVRQNVQSMAKVMLFRIPYIFQTTDPVAGTGFLRTIYPAFTADWTLLYRAEAKIHLEDYAGACDDLNLWVHNITSSTTVLTPEIIKAFYDSVPYSTWKSGTVKKELHPSFGIKDETQEAMFHCLLDCRRIETLSFGQRWFDIKRYGIKIYRRHMSKRRAPDHVTDSLEVNDPRRAVQIPFKVVDAGMQPNPRNKK